MNNLNLLKVCEKHGNPWECPGFIAEVGNQTHLFCCPDGFEQSLKDFADNISYKVKDADIKTEALKYATERFGGKLDPEDIAEVMQVYIDGYMAGHKNRN